MFPPVLATVGGSGTRLYPLTLDQPKPLVELCDTAIIANLFRVLASQGCRRFILGSKGAGNTLNLSNYFNVLKYSPGIEEYALLTCIEETIRKGNDFDYLIFDTPPTGLTLRTSAKRPSRCRRLSITAVSRIRL